MCLPAIKSCFGFVCCLQKLPAEISMWRYLGTTAKLFSISSGINDPNVPPCSTVISFHSCQHRTQPEIELWTYLMESHMLKREMCGFSSVMFQNTTMCCSYWLTRGHNIVYTLDLAFLHFHHLGLNWLYKNHKKEIPYTLRAIILIANTYFIPRDFGIVILLYAWCWHENK